MKAFRLFFCIFLTVLSLAISALAQNAKVQTTVQNEIAVIDTDAFYDDETGIKDLISINKIIRDELKAQIEEHEKNIAKLKIFEKEINEITARMKSQKFVEINVTDQKKLSEYELIICQFKNRQEGLLSSFEKRRVELSGDVNKKLKEFLKQFAKERDYTIILNKSRFDEFGYVITHLETFPDVTKEFIEFYNLTSGLSKLH